VVQPPVDGFSDGHHDFPLLLVSGPKLAHRIALLSRQFLGEMILARFEKMDCGASQAVICL